MLRLRLRLMYNSWDAGIAALSNPGLEGGGKAGMQGTAAAEENGSTAVRAQGTQGGGEKVKL